MIRRIATTTMLGALGALSLVSEVIAKDTETLPPKGPAKFDPGNAIDFLIIATGYAGIIIVSLFAIAVLWQIMRGNIDLSKLVSEADGTASMSRFQLPIFTFVIGFGFILLTILSFKTSSIGFPTIDPGVMGLLGISGGTYAVSKGIQKSNDKSAGTDQPAKPGWTDTGAS